MSNNILKSKKVILHIDVDSFFVSCEIALRPELLNKEIAIAKDAPNPVVASLSYEAKSKGAKVPWKLSLVKRYCKNLIVIKPNLELYRNYSKKIYDFLVNNYSKYIQIASIDEWYIDATEIWKKYGTINNLAVHIQKQILAKFSLPISIGVSYNKFLAKMATSMNKPLGITFITYKNYQEKIWSMPITNYYGIGKSTSSKLIKSGILTIGDLAKCDYNEKNIKKIFLNQTKKYIDNANGIGESDLDLEKNILKSLGRENIFVNGFSENSKEIYFNLKYLCEKVSQELIARNICGSNISIYIKLNNNRKSKSLQINRLINSSNDIYLHACKLMKNLWNNEPLIGIGIKISRIENSFQNLINHSLFDREEKLNKVDEIIEKVNSKMRKKVVMSGKEFEKHNSTQQNKYI